jgi:exosortase E/protease (VPEID-CTERM system)
MSAIGAALPSSDTGCPSLPYVRWACLFILLVSEVMGLTLRFDTASISGETGWWAIPVEHSPQIFKLGTVVVLTTLGFNRARLGSELAKTFGSHASWQPALLVHCVTMGFFFLLTRQVLEHEIENSPYAALWVFAWIITGCLTLASWGAAMLPLGLWLSLARQGLLAGFVIGGAAWGAAYAASKLWQPLSLGTFWMVKNLLGLVTADVVCDPDSARVGTSVLAPRIAASCSGYEGIGLVLVFMAAYLWYARAELRFPQAFCLLPIGAVLIWLANAVRITALILIGTWGSREVALGGFHSQAGWLAFLGVSLGLMVVTQRLNWFSNAAAPRWGSYPAVPYLLPFLAILATTMITTAFCHGFDLLYPARILVVGVILWVVRGSFTEWRWQWSWPAVAMGVVVFGMWLALEPSAETVRAGDLPAGLESLPGGWAVLWLVGRVLGSVAVVPLAEELAFRGYLNRRLIDADFESVPIGKWTWFSFVVTAVLFGVLHNRWLAGTLAGMLYGLILIRRGRFSDAVLAHAITNALIAGYVLTTGSWSLWQ